MIKVAVAGVTGRMGRASIKAILSDPELKLTGGFASANSALIGTDLADLNATATSPDSGIRDKTGILVSRDFKTCIASEKPDVLLDFTQADISIDVCKQALNAGIALLIGTSGLSAEQLEELKKVHPETKSEKSPPIFVVPNFSVGAVLMMEFAKQAAALFNDTEIIELHHAGKPDAPSGTAMHTLNKMAAQATNFNQNRKVEKELMPGARGAKHESGLRVHSLRLPGLISHQEVLFGGPGELLKVSHDSFNTDCFSKGILLALHKTQSLSGLTIGLENVLPQLS
ncbi:MAG: 4-hydroxy-tetrahydrodipicolinate reductase [Candidatus Obscuribacterales bacterium]|nr:4-hydroxy-tetrahydrodipicolinate reductase [Candidatus Obscuribacterales bacterium]